MDFLKPLRYLLAKQTTEKNQTPASHAVIRKAVVAIILVVSIVSFSTAFIADNHADQQMDIDEDADPDSSGNELIGSTLETAQDEQLTASTMTNSTIYSEFRKIEYIPPSSKEPAIAKEDSTLLVGASLNSNAGNSEDDDEESQKGTPIDGDLYSTYNSSFDIEVTESEYETLLRIVEAEATDEDVIGRILVANVVLNRVEYRYFPNSIEDVVMQNINGTYQFSPILDGRFYTVKISKRTIEAVNRALSGEDYSQGALYFVMRSRASRRGLSWFDRNLDFLFEHGCHEFYK